MKGRQMASAIVNLAAWCALMRSLEHDMADRRVSAFNRRQTFKAWMRLGNRAYA